MALGITFIYGIMKMINWAMGEFYMLGSYVQYALIASLLGPRRWWLALPLAMGAVFVLGVIIQRLLLRPMFVGVVERRDEYATIVTIAMMVFFRNLAIVVGGPNQYAPGDYAKPTTLGTLPISGNRFVALIATLVLLGLFYLVVKHTAIGRALRDRPRAPRRGPEPRGHPDRRHRRPAARHDRVRGGRGARRRRRRAAGARLPRLSGERRHLHLQGLRDHRHRRARLHRGEHRRRPPAGRAA